MSDAREDAVTTADPTRNYWPGGVDEVVGVLENGVKVKRRMLRMRACTERDAKGKMCRGHLKRFFDAPPELSQRFAPGGEVYRCERCKTLYLPNAGETPRTLTMVW